MNRMTLKEAIELANNIDTKKESVSFRCDAQTLNNLRLYSEKYSISLSSLINQICTDFTNMHIENISEVLTEYPQITVNAKIEILKNMITQEEHRIKEIERILITMKEEVIREELKH